MRPNRGEVCESADSPTVDRLVQEACERFVARLISGPGRSPVIDSSQVTGYRYARGRPLLRSRYQRAADGENAHFYRARRLQPAKQASRTRERISRAVALDGRPR